MHTVEKLGRRVKVIAESRYQAVHIIQGDETSKSQKTALGEEEGFGDRKKKTTDLAHSHT